LIALNVAHRRKIQFLMLCQDSGNIPNIECWNCNGDHNKRANCPQKHQAAAHQKAAELSATCGKGKYNEFKTDRQDQTGFIVALVNRQVFSDSRFIVPAFVNGKRVDCLRDCGSHLNLTCLLVGNAVFESTSHVREALTVTIVTVIINSTRSN